MIHSQKILLKKSPIEGLGVFASQNIKTGEVLEEVPFLVLPGFLTLGEKLHTLLAEQGSLSSRDLYIEKMGVNLGFKALSKYWFRWNPISGSFKGEDIFYSVIPLGFACLYNSSNVDNNADWMISGNVFTFTAVKDIGKGEEIKTFYGYFLSEEGSDWSVNSVYNFALEKRSDGIFLERLRFNNQKEKDSLLTNRGIARLNFILSQTKIKLLRMFSVEENESPTSSVINFLNFTRVFDFYSTLKTFKASNRRVLLEISFQEGSVEKTEKILM